MRAVAQQLVLGVGLSQYVRLPPFDAVGLRSRPLNGKGPGAMPRPDALSSVSRRSVRAVGVAAESVIDADADDPGRAFILEAHRAGRGRIRLYS